MKKNIRVKKERHFKPHAEFHHAASVHLKHVEDKLPGNYYSLLSALMMTAFAFEAYMNYLGPKVESGWADFESASTLAKFRHISLTLDYDIDFSKRPFQSLRDVFAFRNKMAHPRDEIIREENLHTEEDYQKGLFSIPSPKWLTIATESKAKQIHSDVEIIMDELNRRLKEPDITATYIDGGSGTASVI